jgi:hypothetical protein
LLSSLPEESKTDEKLTCLSFAHDWEFTGVTFEGIQEETKVMRRSAAEIAIKQGACLGIVDTAIAFAALECSADADAGLKRALPCPADAELTNAKAEGYTTCLMDDGDTIALDPELMCAALSATLDEIVANDMKGEPPRPATKKRSSSEKSPPEIPLAMHDAEYAIDPYGA